MCTPSAALLPPALELFCLCSQALAGVCSAVTVDVTKSVLKQGAVQHLYSKLSGTLEPGRGDADLLAALHPTPAVCGRWVGGSARAGCGCGSVWASQSGRRGMSELLR